MRPRGRGEGTPHYMHEVENKGVAKFAFRECMRREGIVDGGYGIGMGRGETQNGNRSRGGEESGTFER